MGDLVSGVLVICLALLIGGGAIYFILTVMRTHRLVVRSPDSNRVLGYYWCNLWTDKKNGSVWWKSVFFQRSLKIPEPPDEVSFVNQRGKSWCEVYRLSDSEYCYIMDRGLHQDDIFIENNKKMSESFKPFTTVQRQVIVNQFAKAEAMRQHSWLKENAMNLASMGMMMMIIIIAIIYSAEIFQGVNAVQGGANSMIKDAAKLYQSTLTGAKDVAAAGSSADSVIQRGSETPPE